MCKTFDAIAKLSKEIKKAGKSANILIFLNHFKAEGELACASKDMECLDTIITLKNARIKCMKNPEHVKQLEWLNIPAHQIVAFSFAQCCDQ